MSTAGGPRITSDNLVLCLDAHDAKSYPGEATVNDWFLCTTDTKTTSFPIPPTTAYSSSPNNFATPVPVPRDIETGASYARSFWTGDIGVPGTFDTGDKVTFSGWYLPWTSQEQEIIAAARGLGSNTMGIHSYSSAGGGGTVIDIKPVAGGSQPVNGFNHWWYFEFTWTAPSDSVTSLRIEDRGWDYYHNNSGTAGGSEVYDVEYYWCNVQVEIGKAYKTPFVKGAGGRPTSVNLMIHGNVGTGTSFYDSSPSKHTITTHGHTTHSAAQSKFSGGSIYFDGTGDKLTPGYSLDFAFGTGDFTVDCWLYKNATVAWETLFDTYSAGGSNGFICGLWDSSSTMGFYSEGGTGWTNAGGTAVGLNTWYHLAWVRNGNELGMFLDGELQGSTATLSASDNYTSTAMNIGSRSAAQYINGYMDEMRVTKGTALWLSNFTPPKRRTRVGGAWMNRAAGTDGLAVRSGAAFYGGAATKVAHHSNGQVIEPMSAAVIDCDGTDDWIDTGIVLKSTMTFSFWYKSESTTAGRVLNVAAWHTWGAGANRWFELMITDNYGTNLLEIWAYGYNTTREDFLPTAGYPNYPAATLNWRNITISFSNGTGTCYLDGVLQGSDAGAFTDFDGAGNHSTFWLGRGRNYHYNNANSYTYKDCQIGQFHVWEKALTAAEVKANFNAHRGRYGI